MFHAVGKMFHDVDNFDFAQLPMVECYFFMKNANSMMKFGN